MNSLDEDELLADVDLEELEDLSEKDEDDLTDKEVTSRIKLSVKRRFDFPTWVTVFEFQNRDGKRADCLAFNCKASRNFPLVGFEFKSSRSDWLAEKRDHDKADLFVQMCDEWYVVAGRRGIVEEAELPDGWGLLELKPSGQIWKLVESDLGDLQDRSLDRRFYTRFMRKAIGNESNFAYTDVREAKRRGYQEAKDKIAGDGDLDRHVDQLRKKADSWDKIQQSDLLLYPPLSDEKVERLLRAQELIEKIDSEDYGSLGNDLEFFKKDTWRKLSGIARTTMQLEKHLEELRDSLDGDQE